MDEAVAQLVQMQRGAVHRDQLRALGMSVPAVDRTLRGRLWRRVHPSVYALGHLDFLGRAKAALLWAGDDAVLSHQTAAALWELAPADGDIHLTSRRTTAAPNGIVAHWARELPAPTMRRGLPVTSAARTIIDLAETEPPRTTRRLLGTALYERRTSILQLTSELQASPGRTAHAVLKRLLPTATATRSDVERDFVELVLKAGLPKPQTNVRVAGWEVDAYWPQWKLVVELDTFYSHGDHVSFEEDRRRDAALTRAGKTVLRFTDVQIRDEPFGVVGAVYSAASSHQ
jgi:very-short-patch-repair endonuclease